MQRRIASAFSLILLSNVGVLMAAPPPIPENELMELCDLVATVDVLSIRRLPPQQGSLLARVKVLDSHKGKIPSGHNLDVYFSLPSGALGDSGIALYAGQRWKLYLLENERPLGTYHPFDHNEGELVQDIDPAKHILPRLPGEVIYASGHEPVVGPPTQQRPRRIRLLNRR